MAFIAVGAFSCKNTEKEAEAMVEDAAEPTEMATEYTVDTSASQIMWEGAKPTGKHNGTIMLSSGTIHLNEGKVEAGEFVIDMNSI
ncbi:MAG TPA: lipid-binding protein, partial [Aequorivita sp.]|nr:lipid-binding protein [Aequorivita sp.]